MSFIAVINKLWTPPWLSAAPMRFQPCPACCTDCMACKDRRYPDELTVTFTGIQNCQWCNTCTNANGSWVLQRQTECTPLVRGNVVQSGINYSGAFPGVPLCVCALGAATLSISMYIAWNYSSVQGQRIVLVGIGNNLGCVSVSFMRLEANQAEPFDCMHFANLNIPYNGSGLYCSSPNATCMVSAA